MSAGDPETASRTTLRLATGCSRLLVLNFITSIRSFEFLESSWLPLQFCSFGPGQLWSLESFVAGVKVAGFWVRYPVLCSVGLPDPKRGSLSVRNGLWQALKCHGLFKGKAVRTEPGASQVSCW